MCDTIMFCLFSLAMVLIAIPTLMIYNFYVEKSNHL